MPLVCLQIAYEDFYDIMEELSWSRHCHATCTDVNCALIRNYIFHLEWDSPEIRFIANKVAFELYKEH